MGAFAGPRDWGRLMTAMLTPFDSHGKINESEVKRIAEWLIDEQKNDGIVVAGTTGESPTLSASEKLRLLELTLEAVGNRAAVVFGAGSYDTAESIELTKAGTERGAHGIMLVNPYYSRPGQAGLYAHFAAIAKATTLPVMLYNIQPRSAINLETPTLMKLAEIPNIVAVKEASGNVGQISEVIAKAPEGFRVYSGDDALTLPIMALGGHGLVSVAAHVVGQELREIITRFESSPSISRESHHRIAPFIQAIFSAPSPVPIKFALSQLGFACGSVRLPLVELDEVERDRVMRAMATVRASAIA